MPSSSAALRAAIHDALSTDGALNALLGGAKIYDEPPREAAFPYVTLGEARVSDFSTGSEPGEEHQITLHAWSRQGGHREAHMISGALLQALDDAPLTLTSPAGQPALLDRRRAARGRRPHLSRAGALSRDDRTGVTERTERDGCPERQGPARQDRRRRGLHHRRGLALAADAFNAETVEITHAESAERWRELLDGAGVKRASIAGRGLFKDAATDELMRQTFFDGEVKNFQIVIPDFGTVQGAFQITNLEFAGDHIGEVTYEMAMESAGALTFAAA